MIMALAIRLAAQCALDGVTMAGSRVYDSAISAVDDLVGEDPKPFVVLAIEEETAEIDVTDVLGGTRTIQFVIECAIGNTVTVSVPVDGGGTVTEDQVVIPPTDAGLEIALAVLHRQIMRALFGQDSEWSKIFVALLPAIRKTASKRGAGGVKDGVKFAARQITIDLDAYAEPPFGRAPEAGEPLFAFLSLLSAHPDQNLARFAQVIREAIVGEAIPDWRRNWLDIGMTDQQAEMLGIKPSALSDSGSPVPVSGVGYGSPLGDITQAAVDQFLPPEEAP